VRFLHEFLPMWWLHRNSAKPRLGRARLRESAMPRRWKPDAMTPFERVRILDPVPSKPILDQAKQRLVQAFPAMHGMRVTETWGGAVDVTPDGIPVISAVESVPGFFIATGFTGHGFGIAPGAGRLMAELVMGETPVVDPAPFRFNRFADGPRPGPSPLA
jgi:glycine/D-amino acid oxidase-like deaminating enzyme